MELKPIKTKKEYQAYLDWVDEQFDKEVKPESADGKKLGAAFLLIEKYEDEHIMLFRFLMLCKPLKR